MAIGKWISFSQPVQADTPPRQQQQPVPTPSTADSKQFGLENFGNTCYANSVLQALYFCTPFRDLVIQHADPYTNGYSSPPSATRRKPDLLSGSSPPRSLFSALRALYIHISQNPADKGTIAPRAFIEKLRELNEGFRNTMHHDAHEFLNYLLNRIVEEMEEERRFRLASGDDLPRSMISSSTASHPPVMTASASSSSTQPPGATFVHQIFEGSLTSETRCLTCENLSSRDESFLDLSIDIEQNSSVTACLRQFSASEMLCQKEKFFCDACCDLQEAERRMKIKRLPNVLALHLKRFKYQEDGQKHIKLTYRVVFPLELRLFNTVDDISNPDRLYELFAIVVHIGNGPNHGHYVSIIKTLGTWFVFDDDTVFAIKESDISKYFGDSNSGSAYVLYYQALDIDFSALGLRPSSLEPEIVMQPVPSEPSQLQPADSPVSTPPSLPPGLNEPVPQVLPRPTTPPASIRPPLEPPQKSPPRKIASQIFKDALGRPVSGHAPLRGDIGLRTSRSVISDGRLNSIPKPFLANNLQTSVGAVNGKEAHPDKSMMSWLRLPFKVAKSRPSSEVNGDKPQDVLTTQSPPVRNQSTSSSSNSSKDSRRLLDSPTRGHRPPVNDKHSRSVDTPETGSRHSSASASSNTIPTSPHPDRRLQPRPLPSIPQAPKAETLPTAFGRTSLDPGRVPRRHARPSLRELHPPQSSKSSVRPATSTGSPTQAQPLPPTVTVPNHSLPVPNSNGTASKPGDGAVLGRPKSAHASYGLLMMPPGNSTPPPTVRRATRKLSLTAPFQFKKRDKDQ